MNAREAVKLAALGGTLFLLQAAQAFAAAPAKKKPALPPQRKPGKHYSLTVFYEPGGDPKGMRYRISAKRFSVDKKIKKAKYYSSIEMLGAVRELDGNYLLDTWLQLEVATSPAGGKLSDSALIKTVYALKPGKKTLVFKAPTLMVWLQLDKDTPPPAKKLPVPKAPAMMPPAQQIPHPGAKR